ncbi:hypothetical protein CBW58_02080 [Yersinia frederiksenii]|nr:hypothetical protein CBW58_02080 [Yersinia frederiksenii]
MMNITLILLLLALYLHLGWCWAGMLCRFKAIRLRRPEYVLVLLLWPLSLMLTDTNEEEDDEQY